MFRIIDTDYYKIGHTNHLKKRLSAVNTSSPFEIECVEYFKFDTKETARGYENYLHYTFERQRLINTISMQFKEWFKFTEIEAGIIKDQYDYFNEITKPKPVSKINPKLEQAFEYSKYLKKRLDETKESSV